MLLALSTILALGIGSALRFSLEDRAEIEAIYLALRSVLLLGLIYLALQLGKEESRNAQKESPKLDPLLGLRAFAFLMVFVGHWLLIVFRPADIQTLLLEIPWLSFAFASPWGGMWIFFTLSGYLMAKVFATGKYSVSGDGVLRFYRSRFWRIYPLFVVSILVVGLIDSPEVFNVANPMFARRLAYILLLDDTGKSPIGALWSISTEFQFYLAVPFLYPLIAARGFKSIAAIVAASMILKYAALSHTGMEGWYNYVYVPMLANLDCFLIGMVTAAIVSRSSARIRHGLLYGFGVIALLYAPVSYFGVRLEVLGGNKIPFFALAPAMTSLAVAAVIFLFERRDSSSERRNFIWAASSAMGLITYSLYVWSVPIILAMRMIAQDSLSLEQSLLLMPVGMLAALPIAILSYWIIERTFYKPHKTTALSGAGDGLVNAPSR